jgi:YD repeat-containing protein
LAKRRECAGIARGSTEFDALGNIVSTTTFDGITTTFAYDDFYRVKSETTLTSLNTCEGTLTNPTVRYDYNHLDQLLAKSLPNGVTYRWARDDLGRLTSAIAEAKTAPQGWF